MDERVEMYRQITGFLPSCFQQDLIATRVTDTDKWRKAIIWWMSNDYRPQSVGKVLDYYDSMDQELLSKRKGPDMYVGRWDGKTSEPEPPCQYCGSTVCLMNHRDQWETLQ